MIWPDDVSKVYSAFLAEHPTAPAWDELPRAMQRMATLMFQAGMMEAAQMAAAMEPEPLNLEKNILVHAKIGEDFQKEMAAERSAAP